MQNAFHLISLSRLGCWTTTGKLKKKMVKEKVNVCVREMLIENKNEDTKKGKKGL